MTTRAISPEAPPFSPTGDMQDLHAARELFLSTGEIDPRVRPPVRESWERCRRYGVDPHDLLEQELDPERLARSRRANRSLLESARPLLDSVHEALKDHPHLLAVSDADGLIIRMLCDPVAQAAGGRRANLFEGASWDEQAIGCNGIGTALHTGQAVILIGPEHYQQSYVGWTCIGVPLRNPAGEVIGALDLSVPNAYVHIHTWGWVLSIATAIESRLAGSPPAEAVGQEEPASLRELEDPFNAVRGVLDLMARQTDLSPTHAEFLEGARREVDRAADQLACTMRQVLAIQEQLVSADRRKDRFLAVLSHELRNPLNAMSLALEMMRIEEGHAMEHQRVLGQQVRFMTRLVDDLLDLARIKQGKLHLRRQRADLAAILQQAVDSCRGQIEQRGHALSVFIPRGPLWLKGDPARLQQSFSNLLSNAARYTEAGGRISLVAEAEAEDYVVRVRDTGIGLRAEELSRVFDLFAQADGEAERSQEGLGIGLALVRGFVEMHGGSIEARSEGEGRGSEFVVHLPRDP